MTLWLTINSTYSADALVLVQMSTEYQHRQVNVYRILNTRHYVLVGRLTRVADFSIDNQIGRPSSETTMHVNNLGVYMFHTFWLQFAASLLRSFACQQV